MNCFRWSILGFILSLCAVTSMTGCSTVVDAMEGAGGFGGTPVVQKVTSGSYSRFDHPEISPDDVEIIDYDTEADNLPEGVYYGHDGQLVYEEAYPTPKAVILEAGKLEVQSPEDYSDEAIRRGIREAAAELRVELVVFNADTATGTAIFIPDVEPAPVERNPKVHLERYAKEAADSGFTELVDTRRISLDDPEPLRIDTDAGDCHAIVLALDEKAEFNWAARQRLETEFSHPDPYVDERLANNPSFETTSAGTKQVRSRRDRGSWTSVGCVAEGGELAVTFVPETFGDESASSGPRPLGTGEMIVEIYREPGTSAAEVREERQQAEDRAERRKEEYLKETCRSCVEDHRCHMRRPGSNCDTFRVCLERKGVDLQDCRQRNITP